MTSEQVQFQEFFTAHYPRLRRLGYWLTGSWVEAEDLAQEAMVRTFWRWRIVRRHDRPEDYARKVLVNRHRSLLRRAVVGARHAARADDAAPVIASDPTDALVLWEATRRLPARQRAVWSPLPGGPERGRGGEVAAASARHGEVDQQPRPGPAPQVPRFAEDGGGCQPESHPGSPAFDLGLGYGPPPGRMANGLAGSVPRSAVRVRVLGRCGWEPAETDALDAGPEFPARFFLVPPQRKGVPDVVLALDAGGRRVGRQAILPPGTDCRGTPTSPRKDLSGRARPAGAWTAGPGGPSGRRQASTSSPSSDQRVWKLPGRSRRR